MGWWSRSRLAVLATLVLGLCSPRVEAARPGFPRLGCPQPSPDITDCPTAGVSCRPDVDTDQDVPKFINLIWGVRAGSWQNCASICRGITKCKYWTYNPSLYHQNCMLLKSCCRNGRSDSRVVSGTHKCYP